MQRIRQRAQRFRCRHRRTRIEQQGRVEFHPQSWQEVERQVNEGLKSAEPAVVERLKAVMGSNQKS